MVKGAASQVSTAVPRGGRNASGAPAGSSGVRRRTGRPAGSSGSRIRENVMNFYTDDSPGLKVPPVAVIVMSLAFILFVTVLHIVGKLTG